MNSFDWIIVLAMCLVTNTVSAATPPGAHLVGGLKGLPLEIELQGPLQRHRTQILAELDVIFGTCGNLLGELNAPEDSPLYLVMKTSASTEPTTGSDDSEHWGPALFRQVFPWWCACRGLELEPWLEEGLADYFAWRLGKERGWLDKQAAHAYVAQRVADYYARAGMVTPREAGRPWQKTRSAEFLRGAGFLLVLSLENQDRPWGLEPTLGDLPADRQWLRDLIERAERPTVNTYLEGGTLLPVSHFLAKAGLQHQLEPVVGAVVVDEMEPAAMFD